MCHGRIGELPYDLIGLQTQYVYKSFKLNEKDLYDLLMDCFYYGGTRISHQNFSIDIIVFKNNSPFFMKLV